MVKIILFSFVLFAIYWIVRLIRKNPAPAKSVNALKKYYKEEIQKIESKSLKEIEKAQSQLDKYKSELEKLNNLKTN